MRRPLIRAHSISLHFPLSLDLGRDRLCQALSWCARSLRPDTAPPVSRPAAWTNGPETFSAVRALQYLSCFSPSGLVSFPIAVKPAVSSSIPWPWVGVDVDGVVAFVGRLDFSHGRVAVPLWTRGGRSAFARWIRFFFFFFSLLWFLLVL
jgi:hypothetical protein